MPTSLPTPYAPPERPPRRFSRLCLLGIAILAVTVLIAGVAGLFVQTTDTAELPNRLSAFDAWTRFWRLALWIALVAGWSVWLRLLRIPPGPFTVLLGYRWRFAIAMLVFEVLFEQKLLAEILRGLFQFAGD